MIKTLVSDIVMLNRLLKTAQFLFKYIISFC